MKEENIEARATAASRFFNKAAGLSKRALGLVFNPISRGGVGAAVGIASLVQLSTRFPPHECREDFWLAAIFTVLFSSAAAAVVTGGLRAIGHGLDVYSGAHINRLADWLNGEPPFGEDAGRRRDEFVKSIGELPKHFIP